MSYLPGIFALLVWWGAFLLVLDTLKEERMTTKQPHFTCPRCRGHEFGSYQLKDGTLQRLCHGRIGQQSCSFTWHMDEDRRYGLFPVAGTVVARMPIQDKLGE